jgi:hypothetical protein
MPDAEGDRAPTRKSGTVRWELAPSLSIPKPFAIKSTTNFDEI